MKFTVRLLTLVLAVSGIAVGGRQMPTQAQTVVFSHQMVSAFLPFPGCDTVLQCSPRGK